MGRYHCNPIKKVVTMKSMKPILRAISIFFLLLILAAPISGCDAYHNNNQGTPPLVVVKAEKAENGLTKYTLHTNQTFGGDICIYELTKKYVVGDTLRITK